MSRANMSEIAPKTEAADAASNARIRVFLPYHLRTLAGVTGDVELDVAYPVTLGSVLDALENAFPTLRGTIRDQSTKQRRPFLRFFACECDLSNQSPSEVLPGPIASGAEP